MVNLVRIALMLVAALVLARGTAVTIDRPMHEHGRMVVAELVVHADLRQTNVHRAGKYCSETGCTDLSCQMQCAAPAILADTVMLKLSSPAAHATLPDGAGLVALFFSPPVPPPKSLLDQHAGAASA